ncbi:UPF0182 family protein [Camelliibacillus cellulosilyticus]|uniref:UPF0182 protein ACFO4N_13865 n=1 Tax=Camelliibacillus cellulosilyticus TaxID=2174486 RepID=A0ABV9GQD2_9BACL
MNVRHFPNLKQINRMKRKFSWILYALVALIILFIVVGAAVHFLTNYIWMDTLGFQGVFTTIFLTKVSLACLGFLLYGGALFITLFWIWRTYVKTPETEHFPRFFFSSKLVIAFIALVSMVVGLFGSGMAQGFGWERLLKFLHQSSFGKTDPFFHFDISFYLFNLPFLEYIVNLLFGLSLFLLILELAAYSLFSLFLKNRSARIHLGITFGFVGLFLACRHMLAPFESLLTNQVNAFQKSAVYGLGYTDHLINIPKSYVLAGFSVIATAWILVALAKRSFRGLVYPIAIYVGLGILGLLTSVCVQQFIVSPNEFSKEKPYLKHNLEFTRTAYQLNEIKEKQHPGNFSLTKDMLDQNKKTVDSIRINDARPLLSVYNQLQTFRTYYEFKDVDVDRYKVDGDYEQVFLGTRELSTKDLPSQAHTWVNRKLRYTHGYGVSMSHVNQVTEEGQPKYMVKNLPPEGSVKVKRPQIYFGEATYDSVIVGSKVKEFDYPAGDKNKNSTYQARAGIPMTAINRLLFAWKEKDPRILVSDQITANSQLLETRNIIDRLKRIAPFLTYDKDPYMVVRDNGNLEWLVDAYVTESRYPYAEPYNQDKNYIRNPVKVAIDAYTGKVTFYVIDPDDPLLKTYERIFPDLFTNKVPQDLSAHFRYPTTLFTIQASMYGTYHMSDLEVFYNREDYWQFPTEKYFDDDITMEPYYITMKLPDEDKEEFILMMPYAPKNKQNMISWIGVRNDGDHYGEKLVYRFPKQKNIYGPQQIENRINQDSDISRELNLWSQGGSKVIRGNLLVIPIEDTLLYVEPIYIESSNKTSLPEVKRIVVSYGDHIVMEPTLEQSLNKLLELIDPGQAKHEPSGEKENGQKEGKPENQEQPTSGAQAKLKALADLFAEYKEAISQGQWEKSGKIMQEIDAMLGK